MAQDLFVDASAWIALVWATDVNHVRAKAVWQRIRRGGWHLCTTNWTLYEAATFLNCRVKRHDWAIGLLRLVRETTTVLKADSLEQEAVGTFAAHADKRWSIVDCASFHALRRHGCQRALAFDEHFRQAQDEFGFTVLS